MQASPTSYYLLTPKNELLEWENPGKRRGSWVIVLPPSTSLSSSPPPSRPSLPPNQSVSFTPDDSYVSIRLHPSPLHYSSALQHDANYIPPATPQYLKPT